MPTEGSPTPTYPQYTNLALGDGLFDQLMAAIKHHLNIEFTSQRITGDSYSKVYLGSIESVLGNTTQYLLGVLLIDEKRDQLIAQMDVSKEQARQTAYETDYILPAQLLKIQAETKLLGAQYDLTVAQTSKVNKEIEFLTEKIKSESANTDETIADLGSLIGRQQDLLRIQGLGFSGDLEAKAAKLNADYDSVYQSVQEVPDASTVSQNAIDSLINVLDTSEKMKDSTYVDPVYTPPEVWTPPPP